jgi:uncharacterized membrane protein YjgN (DUF898 family)
VSLVYGVAGALVTVVGIVLLCGAFLSAPHVAQIKALIQQVQSNPQSATAASYAVNLIIGMIGTLLGIMACTLVVLSTSDRRKTNKLLSALLANRNSLLEHQEKMRSQFDDELKKGRLEEYLRGIRVGNEFYLTEENSRGRHLRLISPDGDDGQGEAG